MAGPLALIRTNRGRVYHRPVEKFQYRRNKTAFRIRMRIFLAGLMECEDKGRPPKVQPAEARTTILLYRA